MILDRNVKTISPSKLSIISNSMNRPCNNFFYFDRYMKKRETSAHSHDDTSKPDTSMVDIVVRITQTEMFGENNIIDRMLKMDNFSIFFFRLQ